MSTFGKVLLVFILLASLGLFYLAVRTLNTLNVYRLIYNDYVAANDELDKRIREIKGEIESDEGQKLLEDLISVQRELDKWLSNRGRVWFDCKLLRKENNDREFVVQLPESANAEEIGGNNVLYVFEQAPTHLQPPVGILRDGNPIRYLGEFTVAEPPDAENRQVKLAYSIQFSSPTLNNGFLKRLNDTPLQGTLALYEQMPIDIHEVWVRIKKNQPENIESFLPGVPDFIIDQYKRHGDPAADDDDEERILLELKFTKNWAELGNALQAQLLALGFKDVTRRTPAGDEIKDEQGNPVSVKIYNVIRKNNVAYFMLSVGGKLTQMGIAEEQARYYYRPLRDYGLLFRDLLTQFPWIEKRLAVVLNAIRIKGQEIALIEKTYAIEKNDEQLLMTELKRLTLERKDAKNLVEESLRQWVESNNRMKKLRVEIRRLAAEYRTLVLNAQKLINKQAELKTSKTGGDD